MTCYVLPEEIVLTRQQMTEERRAIYQPNQEHRAFRRGYFEFPHSSGTHLFWSGALASEGLDHLINGVCFKKLPEEWLTSTGSPDIQITEHCLHGQPVMSHELVSSHASAAFRPPCLCEQSDRRAKSGRTHKCRALTQTRGTRSTGDGFYISLCTDKSNRTETWGASTQCTKRVLEGSMQTGSFGNIGGIRGS